jgi:hypothetical protein
LDSFNYDKLEEAINLSKSSGREESTTEHNFDYKITIARENDQSKHTVIY